MLALCASVSAERTSGPELDHVTDAAGLLTESEREQLEKMAEQVTQKYRVGVYIVTVGDYRDYNQDGVYKATYTIYHQYNMGEGPKRNGIMLLLSMDDRDWAVFCYGERSEYAFNKYGTEKMEDVYLDNFRNDDWYGGFADYIRECDVYLQKAKDGKPVRQSMLVPILIVVGLSLLFAAAITGIILGKMESVAKKTTANTYISKSLKLTEKQTNLPIKRPPAARSSAAPPAPAEAAAMKAAAAVPVEAENSERSSYENDIQTSDRTAAGAGAGSFSLRMCADGAGQG